MVQSGDHHKHEMLLRTTTVKSSYILCILSYSIGFVVQSGDPYNQELYSIVIHNYLDNWKLFCIDLSIEMQVNVTQHIDRHSGTIKCK